MADVHKLDHFGAGRRETGRLNEGARPLRMRAPRGRLGVLATLIAAVALASPVVASARDSSSALSSKASKPAAATKGSKEPAPTKKRASGDGGGGAETRAAWGS
jgi:hypothetical protein